MSKFKTQWNADKFPPVLIERGGGLSMTVPDQSLSVKEIMFRYSKGLPIGGERVPIYHGEDEFLPDYAFLDLAEQEDLKRATADEIAEYRKKLSKARVDLKKSEKVEKVKDEVSIPPVSPA